MKSSRNLKGDPETPRLAERPDVQSPDIGLFRVDPVGRDRAFRGRDHLPGIRIVQIDDGMPATLKEQALCVLVIVKVRVLVRADVVLGEVREDTRLKEDPGRPVEL